ncbi:hypothetical protein AA313_de0210049 [Arthrobotrys entomopaga]|nr:hypothetical protein AA313_de0210049 [Arthrobotrys entomopaga]
MSSSTTTDPLPDPQPSSDPSYPLPPTESMTRITRFDFEEGTPERRYFDRLTSYQHDRDRRQLHKRRQDEGIKAFQEEYHRRLHGMDGREAWDIADKRMILLRTKIDTLQILRRLSFMTEMIFSRLDGLAIGYDLFAPGSVD